MAKTTVEAVMQHHGQALLSGNLDELLKDYTRDSVMFTPMETYKGPERIREAFAGLMKMLPPEALANFKITKQEVQGEYAYVLWSALPTFPSAGDTFHVRKGKIIMQSVLLSAGS
jgi:ketosteroid isomerase-like protein